MLSNHALTKFLNDYLEINQFQDYGPNGLQIQGREDIKKIAFAVSATKESVEKAVKENCDALIVHHGLFWKFHGARAITGPIYHRIAPLIKNEINLLAYHLPLDAHIKSGNAAGLAMELKMGNLKPFGEYKKAPLGVMGTIAEVKAKEFCQFLEKVLNKPILWSQAAPEKISKIGIITGGANNEWHFAYKESLDAYITGEMSEHNFHEAKEHGVHMFAGGHHATERYGVLNLQTLLKDRFNIDTVFFDSDNPA